MDDERMSRNVLLASLALPNTLFSLSEFTTPSLPSRVTRVRHMSVTSVNHLSRSLALSLPSTHLLHQYWSSDDTRSLTIARRGYVLRAVPQFLLPSLPGVSRRGRGVQNMKEDGGRGGRPEREKNDIRTSCGLV